ncbi:MAG: hypothetical protein JWM44_4045 [Bacilli bacterium]|nr:hypothetical protein [Bacilli bacterium]
MATQLSFVNMNANHTLYMNDISPNNKDTANEKESRMILSILQYEGTPRAITRFNEICHEFSDYTYWFVLSTLWVSYTGFSDLSLWRKL